MKTNRLNQTPLLILTLSLYQRKKTKISRLLSIKAKNRMMQKMKNLFLINNKIKLLLLVMGKPNNLVQLKAKKNQLMSISQL